MELVSIVIPVYNVEKYLASCLDSVIGQTYDNLEIICVNDESSDNSLSILEDYASKDSRIKVYSKKNEKTGGAASARNYGLERATGKYIQFLDSDDFFDKEMIATMVARAEETSSELVICGADFYDNQLQKIIHPYTSIELKKAPQTPYFNYLDCPDYLFQIGELIVWNKLFNLSFVRSNNLYFEAIPISDDHYLPALAMAFAKRISCVDRAFIHYRVNTGTSQVDSISRNPESSYRAMFSIVKRLKERELYEVLKRSYANINVRLMRHYFDQMTSFENLKFLHTKFNEDIFSYLEIDDVSKDYFYDYRLGEWYELIKENSAEDILMMSARGYGATYTTGILRFGFPFDEVERGSKLVLVGRGIVGKYWYAQLLLSDYAEVVEWVADKSSISEKYKEYRTIVAQ